MFPHQYLQWARTQKYKSAAALARHLVEIQRPITEARLNALERGKEPRLREIDILCDVLSISADVWLRDDPAPKFLLKQLIDELDTEQRIVVLDLIKSLKTSEL